jgi:hypothetical protein
LGVGLTTPTWKNLLLGNLGGGQDPHNVVVPDKKKNAERMDMRLTQTAQDHQRAVPDG